MRRDVNKKESYKAYYRSKLNIIAAYCWLLLQRKKKIKQRLIYSLPAASGVQAPSELSPDITHKPTEICK